MDAWDEEMNTCRKEKKARTETSQEQIGIKIKTSDEQS
jgi:hypothetical protein